MSAPERYSVCPVDGEPLVGTFEFKYKEWICGVCGQTYSMFGVPTTPATAKLAKRHAKLRAKYVEERAQREAATA